MTNLNKRSLRYINRGFISSALIFSSVFISLFLSDTISNYTVSGLYLCKNVIIGSVFPFMILSDFLISTTNFDAFTPLNSLFEKLFNINKAGISAFIIGMICGFPLGAKCAADLYKSGNITREECERLIGFSNNTGPAFIVAGIGCGMRGSFSDGIILYFSMAASAVIVGIITGRKMDKSSSRAAQGHKAFNLVNSVRAAAINTLSVCAFVVLFSVITGLFNLIISNKMMLSFIIPFLEVSTAAKILSGANVGCLSLIVTSFAISFSGLSVHLQAQTLLSECKISMRCYYISKLLQGIISALLTFIIVLII